MTGRCAVISQPMFFPWVGLLEQVRKADVFVHLDDAQFSKGSFTNRVQIRTASGARWLTAPVSVKLGQRIDEVVTEDRNDWRASHVTLLEQAYDGAPNRDAMLAMVRDVYRVESPRIADISILSTEVLSDYFGLGPRAKFIRSSTLRIGGSSSARVLSIVQEVGCDVYITGHGARNYLDHELFERNGIEVRYMQYLRKPYPQVHGAFDPHVSALDLVANVGAQGREFICSETVPWQEFLTS